MFGGPVPQVEVLKVGEVDVGAKPFTPQGEVGNCEFLPILCCCTSGEVYGNNVSQPFLPILMFFFFFLVHPTRRSHSASFWISFRGKCSMGSCGCHVSVGGGEFWSFLGHHLRPELPKLVFSCR